MNSTTANTSKMKTLSAADIDRMMREIDLLPKSKDWLLVDPAGNYWKTDDVVMLIGVLAPHHPLLRRPMIDVNPFVKYPFGAHKEGD